MPGMDVSMDLSPEMRVWISPSLIEANYILSLSRMELQEVIKQELEANPALEMEEREICPVCGGVIEGGYCPTCLIDQREQHPEEPFEDYPEQLYTAVSRERDDSDDFDPMTLVASEQTLQEQILSDVATLCQNGDLSVAEYLVNSLDERGFIDVDLDDVAARFGRPREYVDRVIEYIQSVAPIGVGARDLRECLLIQLRYLKDIGVEVPPFVEPILRDYLEQFGAHKFGFIAKELGITNEQVEEARDFIRAHLNPYPLQSQEARYWKTPLRSPYVAPDVVVSLRDGDLAVEVVDTRHFHLRMNPLYAQIAREIGRSRTRGDYNDTERQHVREFVNRAKLFISNINQRRETLYKISRCIVELQEDFLRGGVRELRPLTRAVVAQQVGVHESTVSRATANKFVMLPNRKVIPFSDFFTPSLSVKDIIKEMIERENQPLTDRRICDLLSKQGIRIARRTVAKYRAELGILPSTMR
ncbi:RNA polymerase factor sigma-54 [Sphaerobacter thermophilus]|uniref:RNA polymerase factor sigma-54 n=1 Tax=Sphaerobacter thermophilus TaxID=2057 RepID=UPI000DB69D31|nr:MAG: RNA polymerase sigma-54 factor [Sphaerobacter thermophilus]